MMVNVVLLYVVEHAVIVRLVNVVVVYQLICVTQYSIGMLYTAIGNIWMLLNMLIVIVVRIILSEA